MDTNFYCTNFSVKLCALCASVLNGFFNTETAPFASGIFPNRGKEKEDAFWGTQRGTEVFYENLNKFLWSLCVIEKFHVPLQRKKTII